MANRAEVLKFTALFAALSGVAAASASVFGKLFSTVRVTFPLRVKSNCTRKSLCVTIGNINITMRQATLSFQ